MVRFTASSSKKNGEISPNMRVYTKFQVVGEL